MPLQTSGAISLNDIATEFGGTVPHSLSEYYAGGGLVPAGTSGTNGAVPSSGAISLSNFYGTTAILTGQTLYKAIYDTNTNSYQENFSFVVPPGVFSISVVCIGEGAMGGAFNEVGSGGGGGGALAFANNISVTPGSTLEVFVGHTMYTSGTGVSSEADTGWHGKPAYLTGGAGGAQYICYAPGGWCHTSTTPTRPTSTPPIPVGYLGGLSGYGGGGAFGFLTVTAPSALWGGGGAAGYAGDGGVGASGPFTNASYFSNGYSNWRNGENPPANSGGGAGSSIGGTITVDDYVSFTRSNTTAGTSDSAGGNFPFGKEIDGIVGSGWSALHAGGTWIKNGQYSFGAGHGRGGRGRYENNPPGDPPVAGVQPGQYPEYFYDIGRFIAGRSVVRIIYPGNTRQFPSTNTGNL